MRCAVISISPAPFFLAFQFTQAGQLERVEVDEAHVAVSQYGRDAVVENEMAAHYFDVVDKCQFAVMANPRGYLGDRFVFVVFEELRQLILVKKPGERIAQDSSQAARFTYGLLVVAEPSNLAQELLARQFCLLPHEFLTTSFKAAVSPVQVTEGFG